MSKQKLMAIDGNSILNRAFYGLPELLTTSDGIYTNGIYVFLNIMHKFIEEENPEYICVAFDLKAPTFSTINTKVTRQTGKECRKSSGFRFPCLRKFWMQ